MRIKKILAGIAAAALAVSAFSAVSFAEELDIWSDAGTIMTKDILSEAGVDVAALEGKTLTATYEISASVPDDARGWTSAQTVVKYDGVEKHTCHYCEELLDDEGQAWVNEFDKNIITGNETFTYDMTATLDDKFEVRYGSSNTDAFQLKSVVLKDGDTVVAKYADGTVTAVEVDDKTDEEESSNNGASGANSDDESEGATTDDPASGDAYDKNIPDTGVEGVAVVVGIAVLAAGAVIIAKKMK